MGTIHSSLPLFNLVRERLPTKRWTIVMLPRRRGRLLLRSNQQEMASKEFDLKLSGGQVVLPLTGQAFQLEITFTEAKRAGETDS